MFYSKSQRFIYADCADNLLKIIGIILEKQNGQIWENNVRINKNTHGCHYNNYYISY